MRAYKFLERGGVGRFSEFPWPQPHGSSPGAWVEAGSIVECHDGVHACRPEDLVNWIDDELWEVELAGEVVESDGMVVAERGRLVRRIDAWDDAAAHQFAEVCALRARGHALAALRRVGLTSEAQELVNAIELREVQAAVIAAHEATSDPGVEEVTGFSADAVSLAQGSRPDAWRGDGRSSTVVQTAGATAANLAFVVAHTAGREAVAASPGDEGAYDSAFATERAFQLEWLVDRLGLSSDT